MATSPKPSVKTLAQDVYNNLNLVSLYFPGVATELERVLNLGIPLAEMIRSGMVKTVTDEGRSALESTLRDITVAHRVVGDDPNLDGNWPAMWDAIYGSRNAA